MANKSLSEIEGLDISHLNSFQVGESTWVDGRQVAVVKQGLQPIPFCCTDCIFCDYDCSDIMCLGEFRVDRTDVKFKVMKGG